MNRDGTRHWTVITVLSKVSYNRGKKELYRPNIPHSKMEGEGAKKAPEFAETGLAYLSPRVVPLSFDEHIHDEAVVAPGSHSQGSLSLLN